MTAAAYLEGLRRTITLGLALALGAGACGEDVNFASGRAGVGGSPDAASTDDSAARPADDATSRDSGCSFALDGSDSACRPNGSACRATKDCCSGRCEDGYCLKLGACAAPGAPCNTRSGCCSERCEPVGRNGGLACGPYCQADGARCAEASDCCALACNGGVCGGALCSVIGSSCGRDSECCSDRCEMGRCVPTAVACLPTGEGCSADGGGGFGGPMGPNQNQSGFGSRCCSGFCEARTGRCDLGPGFCREPSAPCNIDSECCRGSCLRNAQGGGGDENVCTAPCLADGEDCNSNGDCCDGLCGGTQSRCGAFPMVCP